MNNTKYFDRYQYIITLISLGALLLSIVAFFVMVFTGTYTKNESGEIDGVTYNNIALSIYGTFVLIHFTASVWFLARTITYKMRIKEEEAL